MIHQEVLLGESLLLDTRSLAYFALDDFGTRLWREIQRTDDTQQVVQRLVESTNLPSEVVEAKFASIINGLQKSQIIELEDRPHDN